MAESATRESPVAESATREAPAAKRGSVGARASATFRSLIHNEKAPVDPTPAAPATNRSAEQTPTGPNYRNQLIAVIGSSSLLVIAILYLLITNGSGAKSPQTNFRNGALNAARQYATDLGTEDYRTIGALQNKIKDESTTQFGNIYTVSTAGLQQAYAQFHTVTSVKITDARLTQLSQQKATAVIDEVQTTTSLESRPTTVNNQVQITLVRSGKKWLIDSTSRPPAPANPAQPPAPASPAHPPAPAQLPAPAPPAGPGHVAPGGRATGPNSSSPAASPPAHR